MKKGYIFKSKACVGFTLIELLVVISIIGVLSTLVLVSFGPIQKQARDTQRKSDLKQYQNALETYASKGNGLYPSRSTSVGASSTLCVTDLTLTACPDDPKIASDATYETYKYQSDGTGSGNIDATKYVLWAKLENSTNYWVNCSNGKVGTKAQSGFSVSSGDCPL